MQQQLALARRLCSASSLRAPVPLLVLSNAAAHELAPSLLFPVTARKHQISRPLSGWVEQRLPCYLLPDAPSRWHPTAPAPSLLRLAATAARVPSVRQNVEGDVWLQHRRRSPVGRCFAQPPIAPSKLMLTVDVALRALPIRRNAEPCGQSMRLNSDLFRLNPCD
ncbi:hypothetical protein ZEAMMB73_Zm00001d003828 [Zea mays]|uniref:Uncharacterized protein n=1 Tax=Zea mays TaxID=4577 RepID=A0A1D6EBU0_MAIZE|nr:hypothetical protein ZEAMMB73_Zm00001d003828 [Zea mays]